jgi:hypothetical protein
MAAFRIQAMLEMKRIKMGLGDIRTFPLVG